MLCGEALGDAESFAMLSHACELGIQTWDTAEMYPVPQRRASQGRSEELLGRWLRTSAMHAHFKRDAHCIVSKVAGPGGMHWLRGGPRAVDGRNILEALECSLRRLGVDCIDCYLIHWPDRYVPMFGDVEFDATCMHTAADFSDQLTGIQKALREGKIKSWGLSNETPWGICKAVHVAREMGIPGPKMVQNAYNLLCRVADVGVAEVCALEKIPFVGYSPLSMGLLGGEYAVGEGGQWSGSGHKRLVRYRQKYAEAEARYAPRENVVQALSEYTNVATLLEDSVTATDVECAPLVDLSVRWVLQRSFVSGTVIGARTQQQLSAVVRAAMHSEPLPRVAVQAVDLVHAKFPNPCP